MEETIEESEEEKQQEIDEMFLRLKKALKELENMLFYDKKE